MSTGIVLRPLADPRDEAAHELSQKNIKLERELSEERTRRRTAESDLEDAQREKANILEAVIRLRTSLNPLYESLKLLYGDMEAIGVGATATVTASAPHAAKSPAWESWKARLGGAAAKIIDILLLHGELSQDQIRIHIGTNRMQTIYDAVSKLNKAGIINKRDGRISLKEL